MVAQVNTVSIDEVLERKNNVIEQYPNINTTIYEDDLIILKTNDYDNTMIDLVGYSRKEVINILKLLNVFNVALRLSIEAFYMYQLITLRKISVHP